METFIDDGDIDMKRIVTIFIKNRFEGVLIADHTPQMTCSAGLCYGVIKALLDTTSSHNV